MHFCLVRYSEIRKSSEGMPTLCGPAYRGPICGRGVSEARSLSAQVGLWDVCWKYTYTFMEMESRGPAAIVCDREQKKKKKLSFKYFTLQFILAENRDFSSKIILMFFTNRGNFWFFINQVLDVCRITEIIGKLRGYIISNVENATDIICPPIYPTIRCVRTLNYNKSVINISNR